MSQQKEITALATLIRWVVKNKTILVLLWAVVSTALAVYAATVRTSAQKGLVTEERFIEEIEGLSIATGIVIDQRLRQFEDTLRMEAAIMADTVLGELYAQGAKNEYQFNRLNGQVRKLVEINREIKSGVDRNLIETLDELEELRRQKELREIMERVEDKTDAAIELIKAKQKRDRIK